MLTCPVGQNINPYKLAFWMVAYIVFDLELLATLRAETSLAYQNGSINLSYLMEMCPCSRTVFLETLRVANGALSARKIVAPTQIRSKVLRSGNMILMPLRQLHCNKVAFGDNPAQFDPQRFLKDKTLRNSPSFQTIRWRCELLPWTVPGQARDALLCGARHQPF